MGDSTRPPMVVALTLLHWSIKNHSNLRSDSGKGTFVALQAIASAAVGCADRCRASFSYRMFSSRLISKDEGAPDKAVYPPCRVNLAQGLNSRLRVLEHV
jgi:hypothetical protein